MAPSPRFHAVSLDALPWLTSIKHDGQPKGIQYKLVFGGGAGLPQVIVTRYEPHWTEPRHRHLEDEVLALLEGDLTIEGQLFRAPAAIFVGRGTLYGPLTAGENGAVFLRVGYNETMMAFESA